MIFALIFIFLFVIIVSVLLIFIFSMLLPSMKSEGIEIKSPVFSLEEKNYNDQIFSKIPPNPNFIAKIEDGTTEIEWNLEKRMNFLGMQSCALFYDNFKTQYSTLLKKCIGFRDCEKVCPQKAITIKNNVASISQMCSGCGECVSACPVKIITLVEKENKSKINNILENEKNRFKFLENWYKIFNRVGK